MMKKNRLTEEQLDRIVKRLVSEEEKLRGVTDNKAAGAYQTAKTQDYKATGTNLFKMGQDQIDTNNSQITNLLLKVQDAVRKSAGGNITVTVNGGASNTIWGNSPAGSPEALKKNQELAGKRRDNLIKFLKSKVNSPFVTFVPGGASVGKLGSKDMEKDQFVSINVDGKGMNSTFNVDRDNTSTQYNIYNKKNVTGDDGDTYTRQKQSRVATRIPTKHVNELKRVIYNWGKTKGLELPIVDKVIK
jgi:hypothetical protein